MKIKALPVDVYRHGKWDATNGGISSRFNELLVACPDGHITVDTDDGIPENFCMVEHRNLSGFVYGVTEDHARIIPATVDENGAVVARPGWWMFGGNLAHTSDSRFRAETGTYYPLCIHDRQE